MDVSLMVKVGRFSSHKNEPGGDDRDDGSCGGRYSGSLPPSSRLSGGRGVNTAPAAAAAGDICRLGPRAVAVTVI